MQAMARMGGTTLSFPGFEGATRRLVLVNLAAFFVLALLGMASSDTFNWVVTHLPFDPHAFLRGSLWQPLTYSLLQLGIKDTLFSLLSLWFLAGFLEGMHRDSWVTMLYIASVLGTAVAAVLIYLGSELVGHPLDSFPLMGSFGANFGLLAVIGVYYGDTQFMMFPLPINIKARYLAAIYALVTMAWLFGQSKLYAFATLGGGLAGILYARMAPRRGVSFVFTERWYALRNGYYRWKRRRAARKFEVYMRKQGRTVRFDGNGRQIDDGDDKSRWN